MLLARELTGQVIGLAIEVHRATGPGLLESAYAGCLCHELAQAGPAFGRQSGIPVVCKGGQFDEGFRADILVDRQLIVEIKAVTNIARAHAAQLLTYLRMSGLRAGSASRVVAGPPGLTRWARHPRLSRLRVGEVVDGRPEPVPGLEPGDRP